MFNIYQPQKAKIISIDGDKISLSLKALKEDPWLKLENVVKKGDFISGTVTKFNSFGAFVKFVFVITGEEKREVQGLVHISEFGTEQKMRELMEIGREYQFIVSFIDLKDHRMALILPEHASKTKTEVLSMLKGLRSADDGPKGEIGSGETKKA